MYVHKILSFFHVPNQFLLAQTECCLACLLNLQILHRLQTCQVFLIFSNSCYFFLMNPSFTCCHLKKSWKCSSLFNEEVTTLLVFFVFFRTSVTYFLTTDMSVINLDTQSFCCFVCANFNQKMWHPLQHMFCVKKMHLVHDFASVCFVFLFVSLLLVSNTISDMRLVNISHKERSIGYLSFIDSKLCSLIQSDSRTVSWNCSVH